MPDTPFTLRHPDAPAMEDAALAQASRSHVAGNRTLQLIAELVQRLREDRFSWWTPEELRSTWGATERMAWFAERADIRQRITCGLTGLKPKATRAKQPEFQAALIDSVIDDGDVSVEQFENSFEPLEIAAYAPVSAIWHHFIERMPWQQDTPAHQEFIAWLLDRLLASYSTMEGMAREPILTPYSIRMTIPGKIWHSRLPLEIRVAIDDLRLEHERSRPSEPFHAVRDLSVATPTIIAANIPLRELICVFDAAERAMGFPADRDAAAASMARKAAAALRREQPQVEGRKPAAAHGIERKLEKTAEIAGAEAVRQETKIDFALSSEENVAEKPDDIVHQVETKKNVDEPQPVIAPAEKAPEKPAERKADRFSDRWERVANKVLERVKEASTEEQSAKR